MTLYSEVRYVCQVKEGDEGRIYLTESTSNFGFLLIEIQCFILKW